MKLFKTQKPNTFLFIKLPTSLFNFFLKKIENKGCLVELKKDSKSPYVLHKKACQLIFVVQGKGFGFINEKLYKIGKGDLIYFKKKVKHAFFSKNSLKILCFHLPRDLGDNDRIILKNNLNKTLILKNIKNEYR